jgi:ribosomal protein L19E
MNEYRQKQIGKRKGISPEQSAANKWLKTVRALRRGKGICRKGIYKFKTFGEADQWMEEMILSSSIRESQL